MAETPLRPGGDVNRGTTLVVLCGIFGFISTTMTIIRIIVRRLSRQLGWDDLAISAATIFLITGEVFNGLSYRSGYGRHAVYLYSRATQNYTEVSICLYILRIKKTGWLKWSMYALMVGLFATAATCLTILFAQCRPLYRYWDRTSSSGSCWDPKVYENAIWAQVAYNIFSDLCCTLLPVVVLWNVRVPSRLKVAIAGLMSLGILATICATVRAILTSASGSSDVTWASTPISDWAVAEQNIGIIAANLALSRSVYQFCLKGRRSFNRRLTNHQYQPPHTRKGPFVGSNKELDLSIPSLAEEDAISLSASRIRRTTSFEVISDSTMRADETIRGHELQQFGKSVTTKTWLDL